MVAQKTPMFTIGVYGEMQFPSLKDIKHALIFFILFDVHYTLFLIKQIRKKYGVSVQRNLPYTQ